MAIDVPSFIKTNAERGLEYNREGKGGDGLTDKTLDEARELAKGFTTESKVRRMVAWFARHKPDMDAPANDPDNDKFPGAGAVAWLIWGGSVSGNIMDAADWAQRQVEKWDKEPNAFDSTCIDKMATIEQQLTDTLSVLATITSERDDLRASFEKLVSEKETSVSETKAMLETSDKAIAEMTKQIEALAAENANLQKKLQEIADANVTAGKIAANMAASVGIAPVAVTPGDQPQETKDANAIRQEFMNMKPGLEKNAFFKAHMSVLTSVR